MVSLRKQLVEEKLLKKISVLEVGFFLSPWIGMLGAKWKGYFLQ
jgi:hypothetical protein